MMHIEEPIDMRCITHHFGMKQPAAIKLEWLDEFPLLGFKVCDLFNRKTKRFIFYIDRLERFAFIVHPNACEEGGVSLYHRLDGATQTVSIKATIKDIEERQVIKNFILMAYTFRIDTILGF